jgi:hypothetical protein
MDGGKIVKIKDLDPDFCFYFIKGLSDVNFYAK